MQLKMPRGVFAKYVIDDEYFTAELCGFYEDAHFLLSFRQYLGPFSSALVDGQHEQQILHNWAWAHNIGVLQSRECRLPRHGV